VFNLEGTSRVTKNEDEDEDLCIIAHHGLDLAEKLENDQAQLAVVIADMHRRLCDIENWINQAMGAPPAEGGPQTERSRVIRLTQ
jgi:hypothetical protein